MSRSRHEIQRRQHRPPKTTKPQAISLELVIRLAPAPQLVENLIRTFGLEPVDFDGIRDVRLARRSGRAARYSARRSTTPPDNRVIRPDAK
jgi:hypothetical protein